MLYLCVTFICVGVPLVEEQEGELATLINAIRLVKAPSMKFYQKQRKVVKVGDKCSSLYGTLKGRKQHFSKIR